MVFQLLQNSKKTNHLKQMITLAKASNTLVIAVPFLSNDLGSLLDQMPTIKKVTIYTTLDKFDDTAQKVISLYKFSSYCKNRDVDLIIKIDEDLHGKAYLFYSEMNPKGFIISSGNFTSNGLEHNHEFGVLIDDADYQKSIAEMIMSLVTYDLTDTALSVLYHEAVTYITNHPQKKNDGFKSKKYIDKKPSVTQMVDQHFYIKPVGTSKKPFVEPMTLGDNDVTGFNKNPKTIHKGDILICHSVGPSNVVGYYVVSDETASYDKHGDDDRWPWKIHVECHSGKFSGEWWNYKLRTQDLVAEFLEKNPDKHITAVGTDTIGSLQWGNDKLQISKEFAIFVIERLEQIQKN